jgi:hypothetical protein
MTNINWCEVVSIGLLIMKDFIVLFFAIFSVMGFGIGVPFVLIFKMPIKLLLEIVAASAWWLATLVTVIKFLCYNHYKM